MIFTIIISCSFSSTIYIIFNHRYQIIALFKFDLCSALTQHKLHCAFLRLLIQKKRKKKIEGTLPIQISLLAIALPVLLTKKKRYSSPSRNKFVQVIKNLQTDTKDNEWCSCWRRSRHYRGESERPSESCISTAIKDVEVLTPFLSFGIDAKLYRKIHRNQGRSRGYRIKTERLREDPGTH